MKKLFIDTNIVIDLLAKREPFYEEAAKLFSLGDRKKVKLIVSSLTFANTNYILSKFNNSIIAREILTKFKVLVTVVDLNDKIIELSLNDKSFSDFEDGLQYYAAIENEADMIITRNLNDFKSSKLPVITAQTYLTQ
ncbi:MAG: PIN domain-containing protein [Saprospiraceae bacterium]|nr:PIN domain-containing protein [Saprospiraceae bacterium]